MRVQTAFINGGEIGWVVDIEKWNSNTKDYDIAILHLEKPVEFSHHVAPACLPDSRFSRVEREGTMTVSGWGLLNERFETGLPSLPNHLQKVDVPGITNNRCRQLYSFLAQTDVGITDNMICAGDVENGKIDACQGDSGGL